MRHLLTIEELTPTIIERIFAQADIFLQYPQKKFPILQDKIVTNLFFENSTRTRTTFELAAKALGADVINFNITTSSTAKGESLLDTVYNLQAMGSKLFVVRHQHAGAPAFIADHVAEDVSVINAGDGCHAHPSQALLDMYTIRRHKPHFEKLRVAIIGDLKHSRVARSQIYALNMLGVAEIRVIAPKTLLPFDTEALGLHVYHDMDEGLKDIDVILMLRLQKERMDQALIPSSQEYFHRYGLTMKRVKLASPDVIVLHPGPINRGVEIASEVADSPYAKILEQVAVGKAIRMAIMAQIFLQGELTPLE
jgi:aspartate carbamoyltransferase catalytic subunit